MTELTLSSEQPRQIDASHALRRSPAPAPASIRSGLTKCWRPTASRVYTAVLPSAYHANELIKGSKQDAVQRFAREGAWVPLASLRPGLVLPHTAIWTLPSGVTAAAPAVRPGTGLQGFPHGQTASATGTGAPSLSRDFDDAVAARACVVRRHLCYSDTAPCLPPVLNWKLKPKKRASVPADPLAFLISVVGRPFLQTRPRRPDKLIAED